MERETSFRSNVTGTQNFYCWMSRSQNIPTVHDTPDSLFVILFQSCILSRSLSFLYHHYYITYADLNRPFTWPFFPSVVKNGWERQTLVVQWT